MSQRVVAITGGYGALGRAVVEAAQARGLSVAVIGRTPPRAPNPDVFEINGVHLTDPAQAKTAIESVVAHFGRLDALLNIAGGFVWSPVEGDEVVLLGAQGDERIDANEIAELTGTISWEVVAALLPRIPRIYHRGGIVEDSD